uniref:Major facilitator superfamily (MFS) profile domain-containing protein n=1 Tax=Amblyomma maculatum TaxID=34609 RepID=G3MLZ2_AMBMU
MEEGLTKEQAGMIISSQNLAYAISKFLGGVLSDRLSARLLFTFGLVLSGVAAVLFGASSSSVLLFSGLWFLNGLAQGCGWPSCAKILRKWFSPSQFGTWWSILSASANISGGVAPFLSAFLILNYGWRFSLTIAGTVSIAMGAIALFTLINSPTDVGLEAQDVAGKDTAGKKEGAKAEGNKGPQKSATASDDRSGATVWDLLASPFLWLVSFSYLVVFCAKTSAVDWGQLYVMEDLSHSQYAGSALTSSIESGGFFGGILAGYLTDWFLHWHVKKGSKSNANPRIPVAVIFTVGAAGCFHLLCFNVGKGSSELWISSIGLVLGACLYGPIAIFGVAASESAPAHLSGTSHAIVALAASIGAVISGLPFSIIANYYNWRAVFVLLEVVCGVTAVVLFLGMNFDAKMGARRPKKD